jgi:hypothetical protein
MMTITTQPSSVIDRKVDRPVVNVSEQALETAYLQALHSLQPRVEAFFWQPSQKVFAKGEQVFVCDTSKRKAKAFLDAVWNLVQVYWADDRVYRRPMFGDDRPCSESWADSEYRSNGTSKTAGIAQVNLCDGKPYFAKVELGALDIRVYEDGAVYFTV